VIRKKTGTLSPGFFELTGFFSQVSIALSDFFTLIFVLLCIGFSGAALTSGRINNPKLK
jgi:hypothetical protein